MSAAVARGDAAVLLRPVWRVGLTFSFVAALGLTMNWISANLIEPLFGYTGFTYEQATPQTLLAVVAITTATALTMPTRITRPSHVVLWTIFVVCVSPTMLMSVSTGYLDTATALGLTTAVGVSYGLVCLGTPRAPITDVPTDAAADILRIGTVRVGRAPLTWAICIAYSLLTYAVMAATVGVHIRFLALDDIYDVRAEYTADVGSGGLLGYLLTGQAYIINPLVLARGLFRRRPSLIVIALVGQFLLYSSTGFKAVLFSFVAVLGMAIVFRRRAPRSALSFFIAPLAIMVLSAVADELQGGITWTSVFTRRFMLTPGLLSSVYVDYFSENPVAKYGYSFLSPFFDYPYDLAPPKRIADYLIPGSTGYANANLFADGFANFGWAGVFVAAAALFVWLQFVDRASRGLPMRVAAMVLVMPSIMLSNTSIFTAMLSHGLLIGTVILAIAPRSGWDRAPSPRSVDRVRRSATDDGARADRTLVATGSGRWTRLVFAARRTAARGRRAATATTSGRRVHATAHERCDAAVPVDERRLAPDARRPAPEARRRSPDARRRSADARRRSAKAHAASADDRSVSPGARRVRTDARSGGSARRSPATVMDAPASAQRTARRTSPAVAHERGRRRLATEAIRWATPSATG